ncbi:MAG: bifunctional phosphoribosylaminoimidazolecarboxamide formyltransferase/IMP cyclohydrolase [Candidatus Goldbacteria bacterium]|nr:bifunctional phosphoribosylaminoimidazolecarboxamide formyltransferase/IMP cyclohydrolase [Candidatus Goldiibacteriota bacterium]
MLKVKRALISVSDKKGIVDFARSISEMGVEIISTGGTKKALQEAGIKAIDISDVTGFPEMLDGRVKTLHPVIHGGLLALRDKKEHMETISRHNIKPIDMVVVNLYPFKEVIKKQDISLEEVIENIDIGGPSMIRSAAKNAQSVAVITDVNDYQKVLEEMKNEGIKDETLNYLRVKAYRTTADYDAYISDYLGNRILNETLPERVIISADKKQELRYGENPHQKAAFYVFPDYPEAGPGSAEQLHGKELSFNNIFDMDAALNVVKSFDEPAAVIVKHANPCGVAISSDITDAYVKAYEADSVSAFGGICALNRKCTMGIAEKIDKMFMEVIIAPDYEEEALNVLKKKKNIRIIKMEVSKRAEVKSIRAMDIRKVTGGLLVQDMDTMDVTAENLTVKTKLRPTEKQLKDMLFAWKVVKLVKSNAIVVAKDGVTIGIGPGQTNRVGAVDIALKNAGEKAKDAVLASDAYFPFRDNVDVAAAAGIKAIIQPGGSIRDEESIKAADEHGIAMVFTGVRHFKH